MKNRVTQSMLLIAVVLALAACGAAPETAAPADAAAPVATNTDSAPAPVAAAPEPAQAHPGEQAYQKTCALCHASTAMGAPMLGSKEDWAPRIAQGTEVLYRHALEGYVGEKGAMPERGGNPSLDDATLKAAVDYMVAKAQ